MPVWYRNRQTGTRRVDFPVEEVTSVERSVGYRKRCSLLPRHLCRGSANTPIPPPYLPSLHQRFMPVWYPNHQTGTRRVDFPVEEVTSVELKALIQPKNVHLAQAINYLAACRH